MLLRLAGKGKERLSSVTGFDEAADCLAEHTRVRGDRLDAGEGCRDDVSGSEPMRQRETLIQICMSIDIIDRVRCGRVRARDDETGVLAGF